MKGQGRDTPVFSENQETHIYQLVLLLWDLLYRSLYTRYGVNVGTLKGKKFDRSLPRYRTLLTECEETVTEHVGTNLVLEPILHNQSEPSGGIHFASFRSLCRTNRTDFRLSFS